MVNYHTEEDMKYLNIDEKNYLKNNSYYTTKKRVANKYFGKY